MKFKKEKKKGEEESLRLKKEARWWNEACKRRFWSQRKQVVCWSGSLELKKKTWQLPCKDKCGNFGLRIIWQKPMDSWGITLLAAVCKGFAYGNRPINHLNLAINRVYRSASFYAICVKNLKRSREISVPPVVWGRKNRV